MTAPTNHPIDLDEVREMMAHITYSDHQEAMELILFALQEINERFGWVSLEATEVVAEHLGTTVNRVFGLLTFYADFRTAPRSDNFMLICHGMACYVAGSMKLVQNLRDRYGIGDDDTRADGKLTIQVVDGCLGVCDRAPLVKLNQDYYGDLTVERLNDLIERATGAVPITTGAAR